MHREDNPSNDNIQWMPIYVGQRKSNTHCVFDKARQAALQTHDGCAWDGGGDSLNIIGVDTKTRYFHRLFFFAVAWLTFQFLAFFSVVTHTDSSGKIESIGSCDQSVFPFSVLNSYIPWIKYLYPLFVWCCFPLQIPMPGYESRLGISSATLRNSPVSKDVDLAYLVAKRVSSGSRLDWDLPNGI